MNLYGLNALRITALVLAAMGTASCAPPPGFIGCLEIRVVTGANLTPVTGAQIVITHTNGSGTEPVGPVVSIYEAQLACSGEMSISVTHPRYIPVTVIHRPSRDRSWMTNTITDSITITMNPR